MTFSDAQPVQFWLADCDTFNEKAVGGVFSKCFCQPFNSSDEITVQFKDTTGYSRKLVIRNSDEANVNEKSFTEVQSGLYQTTINPLTDNCYDGEYQFLVTTGPTASLIAPSGWTDITGTFDTKNSTQFIETVTGAGGTIARQSISPIPSGVLVHIPIIVEITGSWSTTGLGISPTFFMQTSGGSTSSISRTTDLSTFTANGTYLVDWILESTLISERLFTNLTVFAGFSGSATVTVTIPPAGTPLYFPDSNILAKSDCLSIKEDHDETVLINYHNNRVFASLNSSLGTPDPEFNLRVPAIFFDERHPKESESMILSNSRSLQLNAQIRRQKWLKLKPMPYYMHLKTQLALVFNTVTIDDVQWTLEDSYDIDPGNQRYPLKKAAAWLTDKNYVLRNVL